MQLMRACKCDRLMWSCNWAVRPMTDVCMKICSENIVWLSAHLHAHIRHTGHCTFTCTWWVHANVHWSDCPMCSCKCSVSRVTEMCMEMCSEPSVWLSAHLHAHVRYSGNCTFTCTWCVHVNVQLSDCLMCSIIGQWAQWLMFAWKCAVSQCLTLCTSTCTRQTHGSLHVYKHLACACKRAVIRQPDVFM